MIRHERSEVGIVMDNPRRHYRGEVLEVTSFSDSFPTYHYVYPLSCQKLADALDVTWDWNWPPRRFAP